jgi:hypothetical protein
MLTVFCDLFFQFCIALSLALLGNFVRAPAQLRHTPTYFPNSYHYRRRSF